MRLAVIADIHGNLAALEAVLADIRTRSANLIVNLGDCVSGPLWPKETLDVLRANPMPTVRGNHDRVVGLDPRRSMKLSDAYASDQIDDAGRAWLAGLPATTTPLDDVLAFHGTPTSDTTYLLEDIVEGRLTLASPANTQRRLARHSASLLLCGHSHLQKIAQTSTGALVVNPGSVGCPAYSDDDPPHVSESGSPHARYAWLTRTAMTWSVEHMAIAYDHASAAARAAQNGRGDWAHALSTGYVSRA